MWDYTDQVMDHFYNPKNQGTITTVLEGEEIATGEVGSIACGDALRLHLKIKVVTDTILEATFQTFGCASAIASSSALTELLKGKTLDEALKITNREIADFLGGLPEEKMHCSVMGQEALEAAIFNYRGIPLDNHEDDEGELICKCFAITDVKIRRVVKENNLTTAEQVTNYVKAGGGCTTCLADIDDIIAEVQAEKETGLAVAASLATQKEKEKESSQNVATVTDKPLTNLQKITLIQQVLETEIKPLLAADGGAVELFDVEGDTVKVILQGACGSCSSSTVTLKHGIEARLKEKVHPNLTVEAV
ncbi:MAG: Fe-S cluster assembly protein NifU [Okeania sp. SIO2H7]|nr:Fe-S cluster assembly protein NifU [Okeania sp. SIO2H7]